MIVGRRLIYILLAISLQARAKTFQNSYVAFEVPDTWTCLQEGVAWTCTPQNPVEAKEAVIVLAAKVAGPEDSLNSFLSFLKAPKKITTKVGTPMPSQVMYAQNRLLGGQNWIQSQHLSSEIQDYYTLYLATVKDQLAILVSFSAEKNRFQAYNPIFDHAVKTLRIVASNQLLFNKSSQDNPSEVIGIQVPLTGGPTEELVPVFSRHTTAKKLGLVLGFLVLAAGAGAYIYSTRRKKISRGKTPRPKSK